MNSVDLYRVSCILLRKWQCLSLFNKVFLLYRIGKSNCKITKNYWLELCDRILFRV